MKENFTKYAPGFQGKDVMRERARKMLGGVKMTGSDMKVKTSASAPNKLKPRLYAKGGAVAATRDMSGQKPVAARCGGKIKACHLKGHKHIPNLREEAGGARVPKRKGVSSKNPLSGPKGPRKTPVIKPPIGRGRRKFSTGGLAMDEPMDAAAMGTPGPLAAQAPVPASAPMQAPAPQAPLQRALGMAKQYAPQAQSFLNRNAPRLGRALGRATELANRVAPRAQQALGLAKRYAPQAQDFIGKLSPSLGQKFGRFRSMVGLKKGGRACQKYAMGGAGKARHDQATASGRPVVRRPRGRK